MKGRGLASALWRAPAAAVAGLRSLDLVGWEEMCVYATGLEAFDPIEDAPEDVQVDVERVADARPLAAASTGARPSDLAAVATVRDDVVGWAFARVDAPVTVRECVRPLAFEGAYVWGLFVAPPARGRGVGAALVSAVTETVARDRYGSAFALVERSNARSRRVFERVGYERVDETVRVTIAGRRPPTAPLLGTRTYADGES